MPDFKGMSEMYERKLEELRMAEGSPPQYIINKSIDNKKESGRNR